MKVKAKLARQKTCVFSTMFLSQYKGKTIISMHQERSLICEYKWKGWALRLQNVFKMLNKCNITNYHNYCDTSEDNYFS